MILELDLELLDKQLTELTASDRFSGVVRIEASGRVLFESAYGPASRAWQTPCTAKFAPGEGCRYNNVAYILLGLMVERATEVSYREYVTTNIFARAGMERSGFFRWDIVENDVAEGADPIVDEDGRVTGWHRNIFSYPPIGSPDGGAYSTPEDLIRFHAALRAGTLLGPDSTAAMLAPKEQYRPRGAGLHLTGFGFEFETDANGNVRCYWKEGINVGASGELCHYHAPDVTSAVVSNMEDGAWEPIKTIDRLVTAAQRSSS